MAEISLIIVSTILTGLFLVAIATLTRSRNWRDYSLPGEEEGDFLDAVGAAFRSPATWYILFVLLVVVFGGGALLFVGGFSLPSVNQEAVGLGMAAAFAAVLVGYLFLGTYSSAKARGLKSSQAAGVGSFLLGVLFIVAVVWKLVTGS